MSDYIAEAANVDWSCKKKTMQKAKNNVIRKKTLATYMKANWVLYVMLIPGLFFLFIYKILPLYGTLIAFKDYNIFLGSNPLDAIAKSEWAGLANFRRLLASDQFFKVLKNTLVINGLKILFLFPIPVITAILLNEIKCKTYMKLAQNSIYIPYFFSWVVIFGVFYSLLGSYGIVNTLLGKLGLGRIGFFTDGACFRGLLVFTEGWKEVGYNSIIYLAAITAIDPTLYEAAKIDGAGKWRQIWSITIPGILPTIVLMLILKVGNILTTGFEQVLVFYNPSVYDVGDIIQTYVYRLGLGQMDFPLSTALGLFNSVVALILIVSCNAVSRKTLGRSIW
jgi:putative aldouronate transport system permease protein